jgi:tRNA threonylcarbamoyl adenosine modification protein YeaZ
VKTYSSDGVQGHSRELLPAIEAVIAGRRESIGAIAVVTGPGSYAGLRVGIATAESLGLALGVPVRGVTTFDAVRGATGGRTVTSIHPAGRGEFAMQQYDAAGPVGEPRLVAAEQLAPLLDLAGEGAGAFGALEVGPVERAGAALEIAERGLDRGAPSAGLEAFYLREPNVTRPKRTPLLAAAGTEGRP